MNERKEMQSRIPDQKLFEPVEMPREPSLGDRVRTWLMGVIALLAVVSLLYISGIYQALLFRETPRSFVREPMQQMVAGETMTLPVEVIVLEGEEGTHERWGEAAITRLVQNTSAIWAQGGIAFEVNTSRHVRVPQSSIQAFLRNPQGVLENVENRGVEAPITVVLLETLQGLNGIAYSRGEVVAVADYTTSFNDRVLAHEFGHILGLGHVVGDPGRLMAQGTNGVVLTREEIAKARESVRGNLIPQ